MPIIQITPEEELKVFWELKEAGPITRFYPGDILIVQKAHLKVLDDARVKYTIKDRYAIRQSPIEGGKFAAFQQELAQQFNGVTEFIAPLRNPYFPESSQSSPRYSPPACLAKRSLKFRR